MISYTGKKFLENYNKKMNTKYTPWEFFEQIMYPLFFDCGIDKYLMYIQNTPLTIGKQLEKYSDPEFRKKQLEILKTEKFYSDCFDMSCVIGGASSDQSQATSSQYDQKYYKKTPEDKICSWIGHSLAVGISGGLLILFEDFDVQLKVFEGWKKYREFLSEEMNASIVGRQLQTWNGVYMNILLNGGNDKDITEYLEKGKLKTVSWNLFFSFMYKLGNEEEDSKINGLYIYVYSIGKQNTTVGTMYVNISEIKSPFKWYKRMFGESDYYTNIEKIKPLFGNFFRYFQDACVFGHIGLKSMRPEKPEKDIKISKIEQNKTYYSWIMATINNEKMFTMSQQLADALYEFTQKNEKGKTDLANMTEKLLNSKNFTPFLENLNKIIKTGKFEKSNIGDIVKEMCNIDSFTFQRFMELTKFNFNFKN